MHKNITLEQAPRIYHELQRQMGIRHNDCANEKTILAVCFATSLIFGLQFLAHEGGRIQTKTLLISPCNGSMQEALNAGTCTALDCSINPQHSFFDHCIEKRPTNVGVYLCPQTLENVFNHYVEQQYQKNPRQKRCIWSARANRYLIHLTEQRGQSRKQPQQFQKAHR